MAMDLTDGIKKLMLAGVGAVAATADKGKEIFDDLVEKGEITVEQGKALNQELKHTVKENIAADKQAADESESRSGNTVKDIGAMLAGMTFEQLESLKGRIDEAQSKAKSGSDDQADDKQGED